MQIGALCGGLYVQMSDLPDHTGPGESGSESTRSFLSGDGPTGSCLLDLTRHWHAFSGWSSAAATGLFVRVH